MKWKKYTIATTTEAVDLIGSMLEEHGIEGIEIEDNVPLTEAETKGMFIDILPELGPDEGKAKVSFYVDEGAEDEALLAGIREGLSELRLFVDVGEGTISSSETEDKDWVNNWKQYFHPFTVDDILIKPTWEEVPKEHADKLMIEIDPGTAFGTGSHETTQLCIRQLQKYLKAGDRVLDIGTGSGILAIAALKLGASFAFGTDVDENAVRAAGENARGNGFSEDVFVLEEGDILTEAALRE
ncbi:MAG: 50S ribosomal protein L11 methyltransferase, partial [Lachnospiraceae bacterium]|nr:50S ribosomal protein L11 methyltransferase [Lachnospiraceae bacterium]